MTKTISTDNYTILSDSVKTEVWSANNVSFEPKGWKKELKIDIISALKGMYSPEGKMYAQYVSASKRVCDVENILLYNIGSGAFKNICSYELCIERGYFTLEPYDAQRNYLTHYYRYNAVHDASLRFINQRLFWQNGVVSNAALLAVQQHISGSI